MSFYPALPAYRSVVLRAYASMPVLILAGAVQVMGCGEGTSEGSVIASDHIDFDDVVFDNTADIGERLAGIHGMAVTEAGTTQTGYRYFLLEFEQPVDHRAWHRAWHRAGHRAGDALTFTQHLTLLHRDVAAPMVLMSTGYENYVGDYAVEPTVLLDGNQVVVEHRYFADSRPVPTDWRYLRVDQAAADHHRVVKALEPIYGGRWISTGGSKGGMTSIFHRRFYPDDVDATVAYVAPLNLGAPDNRYLDFFMSTVDRDCHQRVKDFQREALLRRSAMVTRAQELFRERGSTFTIAGSIEAVLENDIAGFDWGFWQYLGLEACSQIPGADASDDDIFAFLLELGIGTSADQEIALFQPYYVQALTELGFPAAPPNDHIADLFGYPFAGSVLPEGVDLTYDEDAMADIATWVAEDGERMMLVYGAYDPWVAGAIDLGEAADSHRYTVARGNHQSLILDLEPEAMNEALSVLSRWAEVDAARPLTRSARQAFAPAEPWVNPHMLRRVLRRGNRP